MAKQFKPKTIMFGTYYNVHCLHIYRELCLIARDSLYYTTACVNLYFIGRNDDPPVISYTADSTAQFVEGQSNFVPIVTGELIVTDQDHPTRLVNNVKVDTLYTCVNSV